MILDGIDMNCSVNEDEIYMNVRFILYYSSTTLYYSANSSVLIINQVFHFIFSKMACHMDFS